ncbi:hypothetical protein [Neisseria lactamica]
MALGSRESDTLFNPISNMTEKEKRAYLSKQEQARQRNIELARAEEEAKQQADAEKIKTAAQLLKRFRQHEMDASELDGCIKKLLQGTQGYWYTGSIDSTHHINSLTNA